MYYGLPLQWSSFVVLPQSKLWWFPSLLSSMRMISYYNPQWTPVRDSLTTWLHHTTATYCVAPNSHGTIFSWMSWLTSRSRKSYSRIGVHKVAYIVHSLKNRWGNIESWKFKVITKFKFTLMLVWNNSWNIWTTKLGALRYSQAHRWVFQFMCDSYMVSMYPTRAPEKEVEIELY